MQSNRVWAKILLENSKINVICYFIQNPTQNSTTLSFSFDIKLLGTESCTTNFSEFPLMVPKLSSIAILVLFVPAY